MPEATNTTTACSNPASPRAKKTRGRPMLPVLPKSVVATRVLRRTSGSLADRPMTTAIRYSTSVAPANASAIRAALPPDTSREAMVESTRAGERR